MPQKRTPRSHAKKKQQHVPPRSFWRQPWQLPGALWRRGWQQRIALVLLAIIMLNLSASYAISYWYLAKHRHEPLQLGTTFIPNYARYYGLDPQETMDALVNDLGIRRFRLVSYWKDIEKTPGTYDFSELDWQFQKAEAAGAKVNLAVGLRQPRWPECHEPDWAKGQPMDVWYPQLKAFMKQVVERYKDSPALYSYQVENEFFMTIFGECSDFTRERLIDEYNFVRELDPNHPIVITRSNNWGGIPINQPHAQYSGVAVYKRVFDYSVMHRYFEYPYPPWFYGFLAGAGELKNGNPMVIHELQMEPWMPNGYEMNDVNDIPEQNKSMNADILEKRFKYAEDTGIRVIDTWGAEWWYWRKVKANDPSLWNVAKQAFAEAPNR